MRTDAESKINKIEIEIVYRIKIYKYNIDLF